MEGVRVRRIAPDQEQLGSKIDLHFIGFDPGSRLGGPIEVVEGKETPGPGEVIIDGALQNRYSIGVNDTVRAGGKDWKVVGRSTGGDFVATQTVFVTHSEAQQALGMAGSTTFYVVRMKEGRDPDALAARLEALSPQIVAYTRDEFAANTRHRVLSNILPILLVVLLLAFIVGLAVAGLTIYTATIEKSREYGILKAVGFRNSHLYRLVLEQSIATGFLGFMIGLAATLVAGPFASEVVPQFILYTRWQDVLIVAGATILMAVIAAYVPVRRLAAIDPTSVFKA
jgi:putative ABC transport system permease protein